jgi:hypothetical protein
MTGTRTLGVVCGSVLLFLLILGAAKGAPIVDAHDRAEQVMRFTTVTLSEKSVSETRFVIREAILMGGKKIGRDTVTCLAVTKTKANCKLAVTLPGGTLKATMAVTAGDSRGNGTIVGGGGEYVGAKGIFTWREIAGAGSRTAVVLTLT